MEAENNIDNICVYTGLDGLKTGSLTKVNALITEFIKVKGGLFVSDFDQCLTEKDLGVICFKIWLQDLDNWHYTPEEFAEILLPKEPYQDNILSYYDLVENAIGNPQSTIKEHANAQKFLELYNEITELYKQIKISPTAELKKEFELKMLQFDDLTYQLEPYFQEFFGNQIFFRLRFWFEKDHTVIKNNTLQAIKDGHLQINKDLFEIYNHFKTNGHEGAIITTNHMSIVRAAIAETGLRNIFPENNVHGTQMQGTFKENSNIFTIGKNVFGPPVIGPQKALIAKQAAATRGPLISAAGDSARADGPMIAESLLQSGVGIIPVPANADIEKIAQTFKNVIQAHLNLKKVPAEMLQRLWILPSTNYVDSRSL
ncbi:hypothetical protein CSB37_02555 [bacterium DOLZORAL124_38_8]|nr:MAG: hypothetical protein CSB37_02555 [bacterium DOLZORAL124_38_8]